MVFARAEAFAGLVIDPVDGSRKIVVSAGLTESYSSTTEILDLDTLTWRTGPDFPSQVMLG